MDVFDNKTLERKITAQLQYLVIDRKKDSVAISLYFYLLRTFWDFKCNHKNIVKSKNKHKII